MRAMSPCAAPRPQRELAAGVTSTLWMRARVTALAHRMHPRSSFFLPHLLSSMSYPPSVLTHSFPSLPMTKLSEPSSKPCSKVEEIKEKTNLHETRGFLSRYDSSSLGERYSAFSPSGNAGGGRGGGGSAAGGESASSPYTHRRQPQRGVPGRQWDQHLHCSHHRRPESTSATTSICANCFAHNGPVPEGVQDSESTSKTTFTAVEFRVKILRYKHEQREKPKSR
ncbi:hypothetical protein B0H19DRAFT_1145526 [Mycena capillaripes]|nr:hypothetical protein B0H19DRAFT_1145526 [Mycena capillaripes]